jgi:hypothetical protein
LYARYIKVEPAGSVDLGENRDRRAALTFDLSWPPPPMWGLARLLLAILVLNAAIGSLLALTSLVRGAVPDRELPAWCAGSLTGCLAGVVLFLPSLPPHEVYYLAILWMLLLVALLGAGLILWTQRDVDRRILGASVYRTAVVASSSWIAAMVALQSWVVP